LVTSSTLKTFFAGGVGGCAGSDPGPDPTGGAEIETSLDLDMVHAAAPKAKIVVVFAQSLLLTDLLAAEDCASKQVAAAGGGEISNSWGGSEFSSEKSFDSHFVKSGIVYFASTGDTAGTQWPSVSPNVVAVGGTTLGRVNGGPNLGNFLFEAAWEDGGGGVSQFEPRPTYQSHLPASTKKQVPDVSAVANPNTGVWIFDNNPVLGSGWFVVGGTSASAPLWAGIVNAAGQFAASSAAELTTIYNAFATSASYTADYNDITLGFCGFFDGSFAGPKYDSCTGIGSPKGTAGK
jgi:subtilase family serine protease